MQQRKQQALIAVLFLIFALMVPAVLAQDEADSTDANATIVNSIETANPVGVSVVAPDGNFVYALNASDGTLSTFAVDTEMIGLSEVEGSTVDLSGIGYTPVDLAISTDGTTLYVANSGFVGRSLLSPVTIFTVDPQTGIVDVESRRQISIPSEGEGLSGISISPDGRTLYVSNAGNNRMEMIDISLVNVSEDAQILFVAPARQACEGVAPQLCYVTTVEGGEAQLFYEGIEGFEYEWGVFYKIVVETEEIENPPADASSIRYTLVDVLDEEIVDPGTAFSLELPANAIEKLDENLYEFYGEKAFTCAPSVNCAVLDNVITDGGQDTINLTMVFPTVVGSPLIVAQIDAGVEVLTVAPIRAECTGVGLTMCYIVLQPDGNFEYFNNAIEGFEYEWGYLYELLVTVEDVENPPADAPSQRYVLDSVLSQEAVPQGTPFNLSLIGQAIEKLDDNLYGFHNEQQFVCDEGVDCSEMDSVVGQSQYVFMNMRFPDDLTQPLIVTNYVLGE